MFAVSGPEDLFDAALIVYAFLHYRFGRKVNGCRRHYSTRARNVRRELIDANGRLETCYILT